MAAADLLCDAPVTLIAGPEEYLFGEEKALLEVIEGNDPLPRWLPPYLHGLFATTPQEGWGGSGPAGRGSRPRRLEPDARQQRRVARRRAPDPDARRRLVPRASGRRTRRARCIATVVGDVAHAGYAEVEPGITLGELIERVGGGVAPGRTREGRALGSLEPRAHRRRTRRAREPRRPGRGRRAASGRPASSSTTTRAACSRSRGWCRASSTSSRAASAGRASSAAARSPAASTRSARARGESLDFEIIGQRLRDVTEPNPLLPRARRNSA